MRRTEYSAFSGTNNLKRNAIKLDPIGGHLAAGQEHSAEEKRAWSRVRFISNANSDKNNNTTTSERGGISLPQSQAKKSRTIIYNCTCKKKSKRLEAQLNVRSPTEVYRGVVEKPNFNIGKIHDNRTNKSSQSSNGNPLIEEDNKSYKGEEKADS
jgi:hypothetical protein